MWYNLSTGTFLSVLVFKVVYMFVEEGMMRTCAWLPYLGLLACLILSCSTYEVISEGEGYLLTVEDLRFEVRQVGPSASYRDTYDDRLALVHNLAARSLLAEEAQRRGFGIDEVTHVERRAEEEALAEAYRLWKIDNRVIVPRIQTKMWIEKLDRRLHLRDLTFLVYPVAQEALAMIREGHDFDRLAASLSVREDVVYRDAGVIIWKDLSREVAEIVFRLDPGEVTEIVRGADGYHLFYLADDEPFGAGYELLSLRSRRFVSAMKTNRMEEQVREDLSNRYAVEFLDDGMVAGLEAFRISFEGSRPSEELVDQVIATSEVGEVLVADLFNHYFSLPMSSRPYIGDPHAIREFALDIMMPDLEALAGHESGLGRLRDVAWAVKKAREELFVPMMEDHFRSQIEVTEQDMLDYYERRKGDLNTTGSYRLRRILFESPAEVQEARRQLSLGRDFAELAREMSHDEQTASRGGDTGIVSFGMVASYDSVARALNPGEIGGPIATTMGIELVKLEERNDPRPLTYDEASSRIIGYIENTRANELLSEWVTAKEQEIGFRIDEDLLGRITLPEPAYRGYERRTGKTVDMSAGKTDEGPQGE